MQIKLQESLRIGLSVKIGSIDSYKKILLRIIKGEHNISVKCFRNQILRRENNMLLSVIHVF